MHHIYNSMLYNMSPSYFIYDTFNCCYRYIVGACKASESGSSLKLSSYCYHNYFIQFSSTMFTTLWASTSMMSSLAHLIGHIIRHRSFEQMCWIHAGRIVTGVENAYTCHRYLVMERKRNSVRTIRPQFVVGSEITVSPILGARSLPRPANIVRQLRNKTPKAFNLYWREFWNWSKLRFRHDGLLFSSLWQGRLSIHWGGSPTF